MADSKNLLQLIIDILTYIFGRRQIQKQEQEVRLEEVKQELSEKIKDIEEKHKKEEFPKTIEDISNKLNNSF
jgi:hypothetical protein